MRFLKLLKDTDKLANMKKFIALRIYVRTLLIAESLDITWFLLSTQHAAQRPATALSAAMPTGLYSTQHFAITLKMLLGFAPGH